MIFYTCTPIDCYMSSSKEGKCIFTVYFVKPVLNQELLTVIPYNSNERFPSFSNHPLSLSVRWPINVNDIFKEYLHIQSITKNPTSNTRTPVHGTMFFTISEKTKTCIEVLSSIHRSRWYACWIPMQQLLQCWSKISAPS